ncbi:MAG TPA: hypothetical protein VKU02_14650 [Gemmataceae bacterium]|nr:hypothetical protein [Gemmataceae bacterium]
MVDHLLQSLGNTADEVAAALRAKRVRGALNTIRQLNPIARFVQTELGTPCDIQVVDSKLTIRFPDGRHQNVALPQPVKDFLDAFNQGRYPDLMLP